MRPIDQCLSVVSDTPSAHAVNPKAGVGCIDVMWHILSVGVIVIHSWSASRDFTDTTAFSTIIRKISDGRVLEFFFISSQLRPLVETLRMGALWFLLPFLLFSLVYGICRVLLVQVLTTLRGNTMQFLLYLSMFLCSRVFAEPKSKQSLLAFGFCLAAGFLVDTRFLDTTGVIVLFILCRTAFHALNKHLTEGQRFLFIAYANYQLRNLHSYLQVWRIRAGEFHHCGFCDMCFVPIVDARRNSHHSQQ